MKIDHVAVYVEDLERMRAFYERYFGASANEKYRNPTSGLETYFLSFSDGGRLELMTRPELMMAEKGLARIGYIHIAFSVGSREEVNRRTEQLSADGYRVISGPRVTGDGCYESCVLDPEKNQVEITV